MTTSNSSLGDPPDLHRRFYRWLIYARDMFIPRACIICRQRLLITEHSLCTPCNTHLPRTHHSDNFLDNTMSRLFWGRVAVVRAASLFYYTPRTLTSNIILQLKYFGRTAAAELLTECWAKELLRQGFFEGADLIVPVPLTRGRQRERGYNQAEVLARCLAQVSRLPVNTRCLRRIRFNGSQTRLSPEERLVNVEGAFELSRPADVKGRHVILVDDVVTTGATMTACAQELQRAGDVTFSMLALCMGGARV